MLLSLQLRYLKSISQAYNFKQIFYLDFFDILNTSWNIYRHDHFDPEMNAELKYTVWPNLTQHHNNNMERIGPTRYSR